MEAEVSVHSWRIWNVCIKIDMKYYIYSGAPVDWFNFAISYSSLGHEFCSGSQEQFFNDILTLALRCARIVAMHERAFWEGDVSCVGVFGIPNPENACTEWGIVWKQGNNGTSYICSPVDLPWMDKDDLLSETVL